MEPWEVAARLQIQDTMARYTQYGDTGRFDLFVEQFTEDGVLEVAGGDARVGRAAILASMHATQGRVGASLQRPISRHFVTNLLIDFESQSEASASSYFLNFSSIGADHWGRYRDRVVNVDGRWLLAHRYARVDARIEGSWGPPPPSAAS